MNVKLLLMIILVQRKINTFIYSIGRLTKEKFYKYWSGMYDEEQESVKKEKVKPVLRLIHHLHVIWSYVVAKDGPQI